LTPKGHGTLKNSYDSYLIFCANPEKRERLFREIVKKPWQGGARQFVVQLALETTFILGL
jgi:hypothetical protein